MAAPEPILNFGLFAACVERALGQGDVRRWEQLQEQLGQSVSHDAESELERRRITRLYADINRLRRRIEFRPVAAGPIESLRAMERTLSKALAAIDSQAVAQQLESGLRKTEQQLRHAQATADRVLDLALNGEEPARTQAWSSWTLITDILTLSTLTPNETLAVIGCDMLSVLRVASKSTSASYIEHELIGNLQKLKRILERLDEGLRETIIPDHLRHRWVKAGLDYPDPWDGIASRFVQLNDAEAFALVDANVNHVKGLPTRLLSGEVPFESVLTSVAYGLTAP